MGKAEFEMSITQPYCQPNMLDSADDESMQESMEEQCVRRRNGECMDLVLVHVTHESIS